MLITEWLEGNLFTGWSLCAMYQLTVNFAIRAPGDTTAVLDALGHLSANILALLVKFVTGQQWTERNAFCSNHTQLTITSSSHSSGSSSSASSSPCSSVPLSLHYVSPLSLLSLSLLTFEVDWSIVLLFLWANHWQTHGTIAKQFAMSTWDVTWRNSCVLTQSDG